MPSQLHPWETVVMMLGAKRNVPISLQMLPAHIPNLPLSFRSPLTLHIRFLPKNIHIENRWIHNLLLSD